MKKIMLAVFLILAVAFYRWVYPPMTAQAQPSQPVVGIMAAVSTAEPSATAQPTATPDYQAEAQATVSAIRLDAETRINAALRDQKLSASERDAANARALDAEKAALDAVAARLLAYEGAKQADANKAALDLTQTIAQTEREKAAAARAEADTRLEQAKQAGPALMAANMQAQADATRAAEDAHMRPWLAGGALIALIVILAIGFTVASAHWNTAHADRLRAENPQSERAQSLPVINITRGGDTQRVNPPAVVDQFGFYVWANRVLDGEPCAIDYWELEGSPVGKEYRNIIHPWAEKLGLFMASGKGKKYLSGHGRDVLERIIAQVPTAPIVGDTLNMQDLPSVDTVSVATDGGEVV